MFWRGTSRSTEGMSMEWQPMDSAPRDGTVIRLKWRDAEDIGYFDKFGLCKEEVWERHPEYRGLDGEWSTTYGNAAIDEVEPQGWMPLPAPPNTPTATPGRDPA